MDTISEYLRQQRRHLDALAAIHRKAEQDWREYGDAAKADYARTQAEKAEQKRSELDEQ